MRVAHYGTMQDIRVGAAFRAVRVRRGWRQRDVAERAGVSRALVSIVEHGHLEATSLAMLRRLAGALDIRLDLVPRWRGSELDRLLDARHAAMAESVIAFLGAMPGWIVLPEVSFSIFGERGVIDILAFHEPSRSLLVIELKTEIADVQELLGNVDRKGRLAARIAAGRGWLATSTSTWIIIVANRTNQRRIDAHRSLLRAACPHDGHAMRGWLAAPRGPVRGLSSWTIVTPGGAGPAGSQRVRVPGGAGAAS